jgi:hypothetical protein
MSMMNKILVTLSVVLFSAHAQSYENFVNTPYAPYPAGCATYPSLQQELYSQEFDIVTDKLIWLDGFEGANLISAQLKAFRVGCAEDDRSLIILRLEVMDDEDDETLNYGIVPQFRARIDGEDYPLRPTTEPNSWANNESGSIVIEGQTYYYLLDVPTPLAPDYRRNLVLTTDQYNGRFTLVIDNFDSTNEYTDTIPSYKGKWQPLTMPLNGRLSGVWVIGGAEDQGFVISFSELVSEFEESLIFFSWYTFDANGENVWLVGNSVYKHGDSEVTINIQLVTDGEFLGSKRATRSEVGSVKITARNCNNLEFEYDLTGIGLGQGLETVTRTFDLETAGYTCQDYDAKMAN